MRSQPCGRKTGITGPNSAQKPKAGAFGFWLALGQKAAFAFWQKLSRRGWQRRGATRACSAGRTAREGQGPMVNMGQSPIPHYYYNGVVWEESSCGGHKERRGRDKKAARAQRATREGKRKPGAVRMAQKSLKGAERVAQSERRRLPGWHNERCRRARKGAARPGLRRRTDSAGRSRANGEHGAEPHTPLLL